MLSNKSLILLTLLLAVSLLSAWSVTDTYFGNRYGALDTRSQAMGSAGVFNSMRPGGLSMNPANLTLIKNKAGAQALTVINRAEDVRMIPLYNSFDVYIDDAVYASNINAFNDFAGAGYLSTKFNDFRFGVGAYYKPLLSFEGKYREEIRNNRNTDNDGYPEKIAQNDINNEGLLNQMGFVYSMAYSLGEYTDLNIGIDYSLLNADISQMKTIQWTQWAVDKVRAVNPSYTLPNFTEETKWDLSGSQLKLGTSVRLNPRFGVAATYTMKATLDRDASYYRYRDAYRTTAADSVNTKLSDDYTLPSEIRVGFSYFPRNVMRTVFNMDLEMVKYSDVMDVFDDAYNLYVGVEHHIDKRIPLRLGFQAVNSYLLNTQQGVDSQGNAVTLYDTKKIITPMITAGSSVQLAKRWVLDLGFGYAWREYEDLDLFGDGYYNDRTYTGTGYILWPNTYINLQDRGWANPDKVRENYITLNAGVSFSW